MSNARPHLTLELQTLICRYILSGAYPYVAAEAVGVPRRVFARWLKRRTFREAILQAQAQARLGAEARAMTKDPFAWLKCGPGKDAPGAPGWSNPLSGRSQAAEASRILEHRETQRLIAVLLRVLEPFPEVRLAVAEAIEQQTRDEPTAKTEASTAAESLDIS